MAGNASTGATASATSAADVTLASEYAQGRITIINSNPNSGVATAGSSVEVFTFGCSTLTIQVTGTYTGALSIQGTVDGTNWKTLGGTPVIDINTGGSLASITSALQSIFQVDIGGLLKVRVTALGAVTGSVMVTMMTTIPASVVGFDQAITVGTLGTITPGVAATNLGKAEDAIAASGDTGIFALGVRRDGPVLASQGAAGDYHELAVDSGGAIYTRDRPLSYSRLVADGQVKGSAGAIHTITIAPIGTVTAGVLTIYDSLTETGTAIFSVALPITTFTPFTVTLDVAAATGIFVGFDGTLANVQVTTSFI